MQYFSFSFSVLFRIVSIYLVANLQFYKFLRMCIYDMILVISRRVCRVCRKGMNSSDMTSLSGLDVSFYRGRIVVNKKNRFLCE